MDRKKSDFVKQIEKYIRDYGGEDSPALIHALLFHFNVLLYSNPEEKMESRDEVIEVILSKFFVDTLDRYPKKPFLCNVDEYTGWNLRPLPSELFSHDDEKQSVEDCVKFFMASLKLGDILDCRVIKFELNTVELKVIHKFGVTRMLAELSIKVELVLEKSEIEKLGGPLIKGEHVRVVVSSISEDKSTFQVSLNPEFIPLLKYSIEPILGKLSDSDLPCYATTGLSMLKFSCYADYLNSKLQFQNTHFVANLLKGYGLNPLQHYSYFTKFHGKVCAERQTGQALLRESNLNTSKKKAANALKCFKEKQYVNALKLIEEGIKICPEKDEHLGGFYFIRHKIYLAQSKSTKSVKALKDLEKSSQLQPCDSEARTTFIRKIFKSANALYKDRKFQKAAYLYEIVIKESTENRAMAIKIYNRIKTKYADQLLNLEETSLTDLREKKKELLSELKRINS